MRELSVKEIEQVNGEFFVSGAWLAYGAYGAYGAYRAYRSVRFVAQASAGDAMWAA